MINPTSTLSTLVASSWVVSSLRSRLYIGGGCLWHLNSLLPVLSHSQPTAKLISTRYSWVSGACYYFYWGCWKQIFSVPMRNDSIRLKLPRYNRNDTMRNSAAENKTEAKWYNMFVCNFATKTRRNSRFKPLFDRDFSRRNDTKFELRELWQNWNETTQSCWKSNRNETIESIGSFMNWL